MAFKFGDVSRSLPTKGFALDTSKDHPYFHHVRAGRRTRFHTYISHGKPTDDVGDGIVVQMKLQLGLGTMQQVRDLIECPMSGDGYVAALIAAQKLPKDPEPPPVPSGGGKTSKGKK